MLESLEIKNFKAEPRSDVARPSRKHLEDIGIKFKRDEPSFLVKFFLGSSYLEVAISPVAPKIPDGFCKIIPKKSSCSLDFLKLRC